MMSYITRTRKSSRSPRSVSEIEGYEVAEDLASPGVYYTKAQFFYSHYSTAKVYFSYNKERNGLSARLEAIFPIGGNPYMRSLRDGTIYDNLIDLPNC